MIPIVEGHAETESIPVLLRRIAPELEVARPFRIKRSRIAKPEEIERAILLAVQDRTNPTSILVLVDADDDCPATLGPALLSRCQSTTHLPVAVVLANRELEAWFLGGVESLRGRRGIVADAAWRGDPEEPRDAKGRLERLMAGRSYVSVDDQPALMRHLDLELARARCPSLDKLLRDLARLARP